jgi:hypothetical protein
MSDPATNVLGAVRICSRADLNAYWRATARKISRGQIFRINPFRPAMNFARDAKVCAIFSLSFLFNFGK